MKTKTLICCDLCEGTLIETTDRSVAEQNGWYCVRDENVDVCPACRERMMWPRGNITKTGT